METIKNSVKAYAKDNGLKMYDVANIMGIAPTTLYHCYLQTTSDKKKEKIINAIDNFVESNEQ